MSHRKPPAKTELERRLEAEAAAQARATADASEAVGTSDVADMELVDATDEAAEPSGAPADSVRGRGDASAAVERVTELEAALAKEQNQSADLRDQLLRHRAELDNFRKRTARETERIRQTAAERLLQDLLPVLDHLELALQHAESDSGLAEGVEMVVRQFREVVARHGLMPVAALGEPFDPNVHEALSQREDASVATGTVLEEYQRGYLLAGRLLRPAKVIVSTGGPEPDVAVQVGIEPSAGASEPEASSEEGASADVDSEA